MTPSLLSTYMDLESGTQGHRAAEQAICLAPELMDALCALPSSIRLFCSPLSFRLQSVDFAWRVFDTAEQVRTTFPHAQVQSVLDADADTSMVQCGQIQDILLLMHAWHAKSAALSSAGQYLLSAERNADMALLCLHRKLHRNLVWAQAPRTAVSEADSMLSVAQPTDWMGPPTTAHAKATMLQRHPAVYDFFHRRPTFFQAKISHFGRTSCVLVRQDTTPTATIFAMEAILRADLPLTVSSLPSSDG